MSYDNKELHQSYLRRCLTDSPDDYEEMSVVTNDDQNDVDNHSGLQ